ncbi:MAG: molybdopterin-dependent oxidoreductase [Deltaproteobacteria bacterium]|nr:molybdopterin-dependent oxidoreductase [Deltaproteobacteria bacterium]MBW2070688.1 molybdopterin-dependent oxidoreductase [Deltaproteobacteria bacterium]
MNRKRLITRRTFLATTGGALVSIGLPGFYVRLSNVENSALAAELRPDGRPRLPPNQQAVKRLIDMGGQAGRATEKDWKMRLHGEVHNPCTFSFEDLMKLEQAHVTCDVHCVTGWSLLDSEWTGVLLRTIMEVVGVKDEARYVIFEAAAGYSSNISLEEARKPQVMVAHSYFRRKLSRAHGAPVRALVPDLYFYKSAKWLEGIKFSRQDEPGYWERAGYSSSADPWREERFR